MPTCFGIPPEGLSKWDAETSSAWRMGIKNKSAITKNV